MGSCPGIIAREQALHLGDIMNGRRARGAGVSDSPLARSRVLASLAQIGELTRRPKRLKAQSFSSFGFSFHFYLSPAKNTF